MIRLAKRFQPRLESLEERLALSSVDAAPPLGAIPANAIWVSNVNELQSAMNNLQSGQTVVLRAGTYNLTQSLRIGSFGQVSNVVIRGATDNFNDVVIRGAGGWESTSVGYGFYIANAQDVTIANLSVGEVYYHAVSMEGSQGADRIHLYHTRIYDAGQQLIKGNPGGSNGGVEDTTIEYSLLEYTRGAPTTDHGGGVGYIGAMHVHNGINWRVSNNLIRGARAPETAQHSTPANVLFWNQSRDTIVEGNTFIDNTRGVAFGLWDRDGFDHSGGVIRNNFFYVTPGLLTASQRSFNSQVIVFDSPNTVVDHNTFLTDLQFSIEFLGASSNGTARNNLANTPIGTRIGATWTGSGNYLAATPAMFANPAAGDLHLVDNATTRTYLIDKVPVLATAPKDWDGQTRSGMADIGADEIVAAANAAPTVAQVAQTAANPVTGTTVNLSVLGADDAGEARLTYTWAVSGPAAVSFLTNGSNAAKNATATFSQAGMYTFTATIRDEGGLTTTSSASITVSQTLTTIAVTPASANVNAGASQQFLAVARDQFGAALATQPALTWTAGGGTIGASGLYTAGAAAGTFTVTAASGGKSGSAAVNVIAIANAAPTVVQAAQASGNPVTGTTVNLSVLGIDDAGESRLTYTWAFSGPAAVSFSANGSNATKNTTATFTRAGAYTFTATIRDEGDLTTTSAVSVTVNQTLTSIAVTPASASVNAGASQQFSAVARDQFGVALTTQPAFTWTATGGTVTSTGLYTAGATAGTFAVSAVSGGRGGSAAVTVAVVPSANGDGLRADYFDNSDFTALKLTRIDSTVNFNWGNGSPAATIGADTFSTRWTGQIQARFTENYTFFTSSDDGVRLWINGQLIINNWTDHAPTINSGTIALVAGQKYAITMEYYENGGGAVATLEWQSASQTRQVVSQSQLFSAMPASAGGDGLAAVYYDNSNFTGATVSRIDPTINFNWGSGSPAASIGVDTFSARWTGQIQARATETYTFFTSSDDGVRLWINGQLIINNWTDHAPTTNSGTIALVAGQKYALLMEYYENGGGAVATLEWASASQVREVVPKSQLFSSSGTSAAFVKTDTTTQGSWNGVYGQGGATVIGNAASTPSWATVTPAGKLDYTWAGSTSDVRALQKLAATDRLAACWYSSSSFTVNVNITDGRSHQLALYFLDWDSYGPRRQQVDILNPTTGQVLDSRIVSSFTAGQYLVWNVSGQVQVRITNLTPGANAVLSGVLLGA